MSEMAELCHSGNSSGWFLMTSTICTRFVGGQGGEDGERCAFSICTSTACRELMTDFTTGGKLKGGCIAAFLKAVSCSSPRN